MIANAIQAQFGKAANWPLGAALSVTTMMVVTADGRRRSCCIIRQAGEARPMRAVLLDSWLPAYAFLYLVFLYLPVIFLPIFSVNTSAVPKFPLTGFTWKWYRELPDTPALHRRRVEQPDGRRHRRHPRDHPRHLRGARHHPLPLPGPHAPSRASSWRRWCCRKSSSPSRCCIVMLQLGLQLSLFTVVLGHVLICIPYSMTVLIAGFEGFDRSLEEASADLGESAFGTFRRVTLPMVAPAIISSLLVSFTISLDEFIMAFFLGRHGGDAAGLHLGPAALRRQAARRAGARHAAARRLLRPAHHRRNAAPPRRTARQGTGVAMPELSEPGLAESDRPMIEIRGVTRSYGTFKALDDATLTIREGEFFSLLGPSGCGKTTLLRMIAGFDKPTIGHDPRRRPADGRHPGQPPPDQHGVPELRDLPAPQCRAERRLRPEAPEARRRRGEAPRRRSAGAWSRWSASASAAPPSCPAASASASRSPARWSCGPRCCCSTSRCRRSTRSCASRCRSSCAACSRRSASPSSWSPTTSTRRWRCPTASP